MGNLALTVACGPYDRTEALRTGAVLVEGIDLTYLPIQSPPEIFNRMVQKDSFDVAEMSVSLYMTRRSEGRFPFVALPIFPSRLFRHGFIFVNVDAGIREPKDLEGKRVGVQEFRQTAAVWIRGILHREYGVDLDSIHWLEGGVNAPRHPGTVMDLRPEEHQAVGLVEFIPEGRTLSDMLASGEIDAFIGARRPFSLGKSPRVARLFPNYRAVERAYYQKTGIFPIMHTLVLRERLYAEKPWVAESIFKAFEQAKAWALEQMRFSGAMRYMLPWLYDDIDELDALFGADPWPYGLEPNRATLETLMQFLVDQRFLPKPTPVDQLFVPIVTANE
ncbi:MAG TPA: ABC transporter substrate-binding protein [Chloroflexota bacterium]|nr:ABC transporter substrate-binding protein [Chloroflexota bacterium]